MARPADWRGAALALGALLAGCAVQPSPEAAGVNAGITVETARAHPQTATGTRVRWGGVILHDAVSAHGSTLTVLAYPLAADGRPRLGQTPYGRFLARSDHFLDPDLYIRGRRISLVGMISGTTTGRIGQARYLYPVLQVQAIRLWRPALRPQPSLAHPRWHFSLGFGGGWGF